MFMTTCTTAFWFSTQSSSFRTEVHNKVFLRTENANRLFIRSLLKGVAYIMW